MTERKLSISGGPGTYRVRLGDIDIANGIRNLTLKLGVDHDIPEATLDLCVWSVEDAELAAVPRISDATSELLIALGWTPPISTAACRDWSMSKQHTAHEWDGHVDVPVPGHFSCPGWPSAAGDR
ncbi:hypothetical protein ACIBHX_01950 [Nonomuraea sp. NPDC050536]|uniref:hypothetical protein n=1 Tax=Nonomuraea sp. NPDC050536 TaxID=3364366 RepID=UPI0037C6A1F5